MRSKRPSLAATTLLGLALTAFAQGQETAKLPGAGLPRLGYDARFSTETIPLPGDAGLALKPIPWDAAAALKLAQARTGLIATLPEPALETDAEFLRKLIPAGGRPDAAPSNLFKSLLRLEVVERSRVEVFEVASGKLLLRKRRAGRIELPLTHPGDLRVEITAGEPGAHPQARWIAVDATVELSRRRALFRFRPRLAQDPAALKQDILGYCRLRLPRDIRTIALAMPEDTKPEEDKGLNELAADLRKLYGLEFDPVKSSLPFVELRLSR